MKSSGYLLLALLRLAFAAWAFLIFAIRALVWAGVGFFFPFRLARDFEAMLLDREDVALEREGVVRDREDKLLDVFCEPLLIFFAVVFCLLIAIFFLPSPCCDFWFYTILSIFWRAFSISSS
jgi:hypothetical protein